MTTAWVQQHASHCHVAAGIVELQKREQEALRAALCAWREVQWRKLPPFAESTAQRHRELLARHNRVLRGCVEGFDVPWPEVSRGSFEASPTDPLSLTE